MKDTIFIYNILQAKDLADFDSCIHHLYSLLFSPFLWDIDKEKGHFYWKNEMAYLGDTYATASAAINAAQKELNEKKAKLAKLIREKKVSDKYENLFSYLVFKNPIAVKYPNIERINYWQCFFEWSLPSFSYQVENERDKKPINGQINMGNIRIDVTGNNKIIGVTYNLPILGKIDTKERKILREDIATIEVLYSPDLFNKVLEPYYVGANHEYIPALKGTKDNILLRTRTKAVLKSVYPIMRNYFFDNETETSLTT